LSIHKAHLLTEEGQRLIAEMPPDGLQALKEASNSDFLKLMLAAFAQNKLKR
jgi:hypothetical protein